MRGGLGEHLADGLAAAHVGAQCFGQVGRHRQVEALHHLHEGGALALLQARVALDLRTDGRVAAALVIVRRVDEQRRIERQQAAEQAVVERFRVAARQVGAAGAADEQGVAGEDAIRADQAHRVGGVAGRVQHLQAQLAEDDRLAVVDAHRDPRRRAGAVHHGHRAELSGEPARRREVIGVGVGVDDEADAQAIARGQAKVAIDLAHLGVDQRAGAGVGAADQVRLAASGGDLLEDHSRPPRRSRRC